ncbi:MAG: hypothetical protein IKD83_05465 [Firmicutes bacterium]|nr:hypothetical protein [Bacillota bacterium]
MSKELVVYFSVYGTAKILAKEIAKHTGADIEEIIPAIPYDGIREHYDALSRQARKECDSNQRPAIKNKINISAYDRIYVGYPIWWYTFPMIIYTFFEKYDFSGKTIIPFNTHMGSENGGTYDTIRRLQPNAEVLEGLSVEMRDAEHGPGPAVCRWLNKIKKQED